MTGVRAFECLRSSVCIAFVHAGRFAVADFLVIKVLQLDWGGPSTRLTLVEVYSRQISAQHGRAWK